MKGTQCNPRWALALDRSLGAMPREVNEVFEHFFGGQEGVRSAWHAGLDLWEHEGKYYIDLDLPGVKSEDLDITFEERLLRVKAERKAVDPQPAYLHRERTSGVIERVVKLPEGIDRDSIEATLTDGVLHITLSKRPETQPKKVTVKTA